MFKQSCFELYLILGRDYGDLLDKETTSGKDVDMADSAEIAHAHAQAQENGVEPSGMGVAKAEV